MSRKNGINKSKVITTNVDGRREKEYTTTLGVVIRVGPMPPMLPELLDAAIRMEWEESDKPLPVKPTYIVTNVAGDKETHEHDEKSLTTDEEKKEWADWKATQQRFENDVNNALFEELVRNSIRFDIDPSWPMRYKRLRPPTDPIEAAYFYARAAVIGGKQDVEAIMRYASELTGVDARLMQAVEDSFPTDVEEDDPTPAVAESGG